MTRSIRKRKHFFCILFVVIAAFLYNAFVYGAFAQERFSLSEKALRQLAELQNTSPSTLRGEENHSILDYAKTSSCLHKILPQRTYSGREILKQKSREYAASGQEQASGATFFVPRAFSDFSANPFGSFHLSSHVVQRK